MPEFPFDQNDCQTLKDIFENKIKGSSQNPTINLLLGFLTGLVCTASLYSTNIVINNFLGKNVVFDENETSLNYINLTSKFHKYILNLLTDSNSNNSTQEYKTILVANNNELIEFQDADTQTKKDFLRGFCIIPSGNNVQSELLFLTNELKKEIDYNDEKDPIIHYLILLSILKLAAQTKSNKYEEIQIISNYSIFKKQIVKFSKLPIVSENINTIIGNLFEIAKFMKECYSQKLFQFMKNEDFKMNFNDVCLCGSGIKYNDCCSNVNATIH